MEALGLECGPEALHGGIIVTASLPAHAGADLAGVQVSPQRKFENQLRLGVNQVSEVRNCDLPHHYGI